jgi:hypothetical protein
MQATVEKGRPWVSLRDSLNGFVSDGVTKRQPKRSGAVLGLPRVVECQ